MTIIYRACDGMEFHDEYDCEYHEQCLKWDKLLAESNFSIYDNCHEPMAFDFHHDDEVENAYNTSYYVTIRNEAAAQLMKEINEYFGFFFPTEIGMYHFVGDCGGEWKEI